MRIGKKAWRMLATAVAVPGSALGALAGFAAAPAMAGTAQPQTPSPAETFYGYSASTQFIPVYASGIFKDQGHLVLGGNGTATDVLRHGSINITTTDRVTTPWLSQQSCNGGYTETFSYTTAAGGTGRYSGATGAGTGSLAISAVMRRNNGTCDGNDPIPKTIRITLDVSGSFHM
jgi:hypothetical protein